MATAVRREAWDHTSSVAAVVLNSRPGVRRRDLVTAEEIHPMRRAERKKLRGPAAMGALRSAFGG